MKSQLLKVALEYFAVVDYINLITAPLKQLAVKWRVEINREYSEMSKLKTEIPGQQTVHKGD